MKIKIAMLFLLCLGLLSLCGCISNNAGKKQIEQGTSDLSETPKNTESICGNGIAEKGETYGNCCIDIPCPEGFMCKNNTEKDKLIYFCKKDTKEETFEFKKYLKLLDTIKSEYAKPETSLIDWDLMTSNVKSMKEYLDILEKRGYDVSIDNEFLKEINQTIYLDRLSYKKVEHVESFSETEQKELLNEIINIYQTDLNRLSQINSSVKIELDKQYLLDIDEKIRFEKEKIATLNKLKENIEKGYTATIDVTDFNSNCDFSKRGHLTSITIGIKNTGGFTIGNPTVDLFLMEGDSRIDKSTGSSFGYGALMPNEERFETVYPSIGYSSTVDIQCKQYDLKINLRSGSNPKVIATKTVTIEIK